MPTFLGIPRVISKKLLRKDSAHADHQWVQGDPLPEHTLQWGSTFPQGAQTTLRNHQMRKNLRHATTTIRNKRAMRVAETPDWQELRDAAAAIKHETMSNLPELLLQLEENVTAHGGIVHWAKDAAEANQIILKILKEKNATEVVKVKSMATQEINLNEELLKHGIQAWETDLAEMIVQLGEDMPSHIVVPAIHRNRAEIREIFMRKMADAPDDLTTNPQELAMAARAHLRELFLKTKVAISGSNMMIAETGTLSIFESEGNGRMCLTLPETLISLVGIEKIVPRFKDAEVFAQLLPRSATGERMNPYTSFWNGVTPGDGPQEFHLVLLDNGRSKVLADPIGRQALHCIRCASCMNVCPVYEHVGGHAYNSIYPGPIGAILTPQLLGAMHHDSPASSLPYASSLCGACFEVCPVKINIPEVLVDLRHRITEENRGGLPDVWDIAMKASSKIMGNSQRWSIAARGVTKGGFVAGKDEKIARIPVPIASRWTSVRDVPAPPAKTFRDWYKETHR